MLLKLWFEDKMGLKKKQFLKIYYPTWQDEWTWIQLGEDLRSEKDLCVKSYRTEYRRILNTSV